MFAVLALLQPLDPATGQRVDVRVASLPGSGFQGLGQHYWEPAISRRPRASIELFALDLSAGTRVAAADMELALSQIQEVDTTGLHWPGAPVSIYRADSLAWPAPAEFSGVVSTAPVDINTGRLIINMRVSADQVDKPLLVSEFTGGGGRDGEPEMRGTLKPFGAGRCFNVEPIMFDTVRNIAMLDGYGNLLAVDWLGEGLSSFGPAVDDYADYAALAAAIDAKVVAPGQWATSIASGMIGLGAPPAGVITCHCRFGFGMTGSLIRRILRQHAALPAAMIEDASLAALDVAVPYPVHFWTKDQISVKSLAEQLAAGCNASPVITFQNRYAVVRPFSGARIGTFKRFGFSEPAVTAWKSADPVVPTWQVKVRVARPVRVMTTDEVNYADTIINRGVFDPAETYRQGNTVWTDDGAQWLYRNVTAAAGHVPPATAQPDADGFIGDDWWEQLKPQTTAQVADGYRDAMPIVPGNAYAKGDIGTDQGARWIYIADLVWDDTMPPQLPGESNAFWSLVKDAQSVTIRTNITAITIQADYQSRPIDGQLPTGGRGILSVGSVIVDGAGIAWSVATSGCDATIDEDGAFSITAARTSGYVDVKATYHDQTYTARVAIALNVAAPPADSGSPTSGGGGGGGGTGAGTSATITDFPSVSSAAYPAAPSTTAFVTAGGGGLTFSGSLTYAAASQVSNKIGGNATVFVKVVYRMKDSGAGWTDAGPETAGSQALSGSYPDFEQQYGTIDFSGLVVAAAVAGTAYEFGVLLRRSGNSSTQPYGSINGAGT